MDFRCRPVHMSFSVLTKCWAPPITRVQPFAHSIVRRCFSVEAAKWDQKRTAIVTGSSRGIGEAIARRLALEGYAVAINDVAANKPGIDTLVAELNETYGKGTSTGIVADVSSSAEVKAMFEESANTLGPLTVMVANAGIHGVGAALDLSEKDVAQIMKVNFTGVWNCYTHAARQMIAQGPVPEGSSGYKLLAASSIAAYKPFPLLAHYCASKWAVRGLTQVFAIEMAPHKINVNCYAPGIVGTHMWEDIDKKLGDMQGRAKGETVQKFVTELTAMGRLANSIYDALGATTDQGFPIVDCSLASSPATINLSFQGITVNVPVGQLIVDNPGGTECQLGLGISSGTSFLGDNALSSMYVVYDMDNNQISLAPTVFNAPDSKILQIMAGPNGFPKGPGVGASTSSSSTAPTSTAQTLRCNADNCLRSFRQRPEAIAFCSTYTAGGPQGVERMFLFNYCEFEQIVFNT
ncbi:hypothetical protein IFR04_016041 [Cadophora malorum]|uniref:Peptidase A1 domain-containing protein n=1 Tax=Cadophora malorum TaxID=108018 RepID=A0A8H7T1Z3_9HELO|nr:hypothetical protein IFR04_016041 [Cadophora malorum]